MGLYSKDTATKLDLVVEMVLMVGSKQILSISKKQIGKSVWSIALQSRQFGSPSLEWPPFKDSTSTTER